MNRKIIAPFYLTLCKKNTRIDETSLKCEPSESKLGSMLQSLHTTHENLVTNENMFYTIAHIDHNSMFIFIIHCKETSFSSSSSKKLFDFFTIISIKI